MRRRRLLVGLVGLLTAGLGVGTLSSAAEAVPFCGQVWGSLPEQVGEGPGGPLITNVRAGRHACFDRLVVDLNGPSFGYRVEYVPAVPAQGTGDPLSLRGGAFLDVTVYAFTYDQNGTPTFTPPSRANVVNVGGFRTLRQVADGGSFEGYTTFGVGVRARLPFRVFVLNGPGAGSRLVIDVAHRW
jgi:hypothetical protein